MDNDKNKKEELKEEELEKVAGGLGTRTYVDKAPINNPTIEIKIEGQSKPQVINIEKDESIYK